MTEIEAQYIFSCAMADRAMLVWQFDDAPERFRALSPHGGDEDWVALIPPDYDCVPWAENGTAFGCCRVSVHDVGHGWTVRIGAHA